MKAAPYPKRARRSSFCPWYAASSFLLMQLRYFHMFLWVFPHACYKYIPRCFRWISQAFPTFFAGPEGAQHLSFPPCGVELPFWEAEVFPQYMSFLKFLNRTVAFSTGCPKKKSTINNNNNNNDNNDDDNNDYKNSKRVFLCAWPACFISTYQMLYGLHCTVCTL